MTAHTKKHGISSTDDHDAGTDGTLIGTESGALAEKAFGTNTTADQIVQRDGNGDVIVPDTPTSESGAAPKKYVDGVAQGLSTKDSVRVKSDSNLTLSGEQTVDGVALVTGDRILVAGQTTGTEDGIYVVDSGAWSRSDDMASGANAGGSYVFIEEGTYADEGFVCTNDKGSDVVGTDALTFSQFSGAGHVSAGDGLTKTGDTLDVVGGDGIAVAADSVAADLVAAGADAGGLEISGGAIQVKTDGDHGVKLTSTGVEAEVDTTKGLSVGASGIAVDLVAAGAGAGGLEMSGGDIQVKVAAANPLKRGGSGLFMQFAETDPGVEYDDGGLRVKADGDHGIVRGSSGVEVELEGNKGLTVGTNGLAIDPDSETGATVAPITLNANGAGVTVDNDKVTHTAGELTVAGKVQQDNVSLAGTSPVRADVSGWSDGDRGVGVGTDGSVWHIYRKDGTHVYAVEMTEVGS